MLGKNDGKVAEEQKGKVCVVQPGLQDSDDMDKDAVDFRKELLVVAGQFRPPRRNVSPESQGYEIIEFCIKLWGEERGIWRIWGEDRKEKTPGERRLDGPRGCGGTRGRWHRERASWETCL